MRIDWSAKVILLAVLPVLLAAGIFFLAELKQVRDLHLEQTREDLRGTAIMLAHEIGSGSLEDGTLQERMRVRGRSLGDRFTIIAADGRVIADSEVERVAEMENHGTRPEVVRARTEGAVLLRRYSRTLGRELLYAAAPVPGSEAVARVARDVSGLEEQLDSATAHLWWVATIAILLGGAGAFFFARRLVRPIHALTVAAAAVEAGNLEASVKPVGSDEVARLGEAFNRMTARLRQSLGAAKGEAARLATILEGMSEGVIAIEGEDRISFLNRSARVILGIGQGEEVEGKGLYELVRDRRLLGLLRSVGAGNPRVEGEIVLEGPPKRTILIHAARVGGGDSDAILVLGDVSTLRRLERMRSDFVSNVSHELRTPLASIAAAVETLEDSSARMDEETGSRFVSMIRRNVARLEALLDDILALSRMESRPETIRMRRLDVSAVVRAACEDLEQRAGASEVGLSLETSDRTEVMGDIEAFRRIADNLILNAITYTPAGGQVSVRLREEGGMAVLVVEDDGIGIPAADLDRIFERFYRVEKARSRAAGGTGLGLAIVKHAVGLHGGNIEIASQPGKGSTFTVRVPKLGDPSTSGKPEPGESGTASQ